MRILIPARQQAHNISMQTCVPVSSLSMLNLPHLSCCMTAEQFEHRNTIQSCVAGNNTEVEGEAAGSSISRLRRLPSGAVAGDTCGLTQPADHQHDERHPSDVAVLHGQCFSAPSPPHPPQALLPNVQPPPLAWNAQMLLNITFQVSLLCDSDLQSVEFL